MRNDPNQLDLFESRPSCVIIDARPIIARRVREYVIAMAMAGKFVPIDADILPLTRKTA